MRRRSGANCKGLRQMDRPRRPAFNGLAIRRSVKFLDFGKPAENGQCRGYGMAGMRAMER
jgi:hypothetical protein